MTNESSSDGRYAPLPDKALELCRMTGAPPRLVAHLTLVHDAARRLVNGVHAVFPALKFDEEAIYFGAATHDLGKTIHSVELSESGMLHESRGVELLRELGVPEDLARFAYTHNNWTGSVSVKIEDLLVALADKCWKGKRVTDLETLATETLAELTGIPQWHCYAVLDDLLQDLASDADARLEWQRSFPLI
jgi:putative nucleotidyltransferase with HDIG domain